MRPSRIFGAPSSKTNYYHVITRNIQGLTTLKDKAAKAKMREIIFKEAAMSDLRVLTYAIMDDHFHLLLAVDNPEHGRAQLDDQAILNRLRPVTEEGMMTQIHETLQRLKEESPDEKYPHYRQGLLSRMYDLSTFMKEVKQRFGQWYNRRQGRRGPLWEQRFKSVLLEPDKKLLKTIGAYIDFNPVRAGLVKDPEDYRWCGYADAVGGDATMRSGLKEACGKSSRTHWSTCQAEYAIWLLGSDEEAAELPPAAAGGKKARAGSRRELVRKVMAKEGQLGWPTLLRCRIRYFTDSKAIGREAFLEEVFGRSRERLRVKRKIGARRLRGLKLGDDWRTLIDLRGDVIL